MVAVAGLGLGAVVAAQVGLVSLLCIRTGLRFGFRPAVAGVATSPSVSDSALDVGPMPSSLPATNLARRSHQRTCGSGH